MDTYLGDRLIIYYIFTQIMAYFRNVNFFKKKQGLFYFKLNLGLDSFTASLGEG